VLQCGSVDLIDGLFLACKKPPVIVRELANSQLLKAPGSGSSATVRTTTVLRSLTTSVADLSLDSNNGPDVGESGLTRNGRKKKKAADKKRKYNKAPAAAATSHQPKPTKTKASVLFSENGGHGKTCTSMITQQAWTTDNDSPIYSKFKGCSFFRPKAPKGTAGTWAHPNAASQILAKGGRGPDGQFGRGGKSKPKTFFLV
jgi:hypothetical protein